MKPFCALIAACLAVAPGAALAASKSFSVPPFDRISVSAGIELEATVGPQQSVTAETDNGDFSDLAISVQGGELEIGRPAKFWTFGWQQGPHYKVEVSVPALHGLHASSSASAQVTGPVTGDAAIAASSSGHATVAQVKGGKIVLQASSSGALSIAALQGDAALLDASSSGAMEVAQLKTDSIEMHASSSGTIAVGELHAGSAAIEVSSSGTVEAAGDCNTLMGLASSGGRIQGSKLQCAGVEAHASSGGGIAAFATQSVAAEASSGGNITISGKPPKVEQHESSGGSVVVEK